MIVSGLAEAVLDCSVPALLIRHQGVNLEKGLKQESLTEEKDIHASISPMTGKDLKRMAQGQLAEGSVLIITTTELFTVRTSACQTADVVRYNNVDYQISMVNDWFDLGGFYEAIGTRLPR
jgi:hypothetical protein